MHSFAHDDRPVRQQPLLQAGSLLHDVKSFSNKISMLKSPHVPNSLIDSIALLDSDTLHSGFEKLDSTLVNLKKTNSEKGVKKNQEEQFIGNLID